MTPKSRPANPDIIREIVSGDYGGIAGKIRLGLQDALGSSGASGFVIGLSGGIDSAVTAALCSGVPGGGTLAVILPDSDVTPESETADALEMAGILRIRHALTDIRGIIGAYSAALGPHARALGNLRARIRSSILYHYANAENLLVVGSSDRSEYQIGYFTKFGDGAADTFPLVSLYKLQVREMARHLGVPPRIISKRSSPHLWRGHTAEGEIGASYEEIDAVLYLHLDRGMPPDRIPEEAGVPRSVVDRVISLHRSSMHKRWPSG